MGIVRDLPILVVGICVGGGIAWGFLGSSAPSAPMPVPQAQPLICDQSDLKQMKERVAQLESELASTKRVESVTSGAPDAAAVTSSQEDTLSWKISAIEKFVPLSDEQRDRIREKYTKEREGDSESAESLDDILGAESATFYRERVQAAFKKVQDEEVDREVVWLSRKLSLTQEQEASVRTILANVEADVSKGETHGQSGATPQERVREMIAQNRRRAELRNEQLKGVLTPEQFEAYLQAEAESSASDVEIFHDPTGGAATPSSDAESR